MALGTGYSSLLYETYLCPFLGLLRDVASLTGFPLTISFRFRQSRQPAFQPANVSVA